MTQFGSIQFNPNIVSIHLRSALLSLVIASATESAYIALARNEDIFFKLGWHVKNRSFKEGNNSFLK